MVKNHAFPLVLLTILAFLLTASCSSLSTPELRTTHFESDSEGYQSPQFQSPKYKNQIQTDSESKLPPAGDDRLLLSWPVRGEVRLSRGFLLGTRPHQGLDLAAPKGTGIYSAHDGYVEYAGKDFSGYGRLIILNSGAGWSTFYAHLSRIRVTEKSQIRRGQRIGDMGATGRASGVHLHFELRYNERPVDPLDYLPAL